MRPRSSVGRMGVGRLLVLAVLLSGSGLPAASAAELANRFAPGALGYAETASLGDIVERFQQSNYWTAVTQSPQWKQVGAQLSEIDWSKRTAQSTPENCGAFVFKHRRSVQTRRREAWGASSNR